MFWVSLLVLVVIGGILATALWYLAPGIWRQVAVIVIVLVLGVCGIYGVATMQQGTDTTAARADLVATGYMLEHVEAPHPFQDDDDLSVAYSQRDRSGFIDGYVNAPRGFYSTGFGYADIVYAAARQECATLDQDCLKVERLPCIVRFSLNKDDNGWYLVPGTAEVIEPPLGICEAMDVRALEKRILKLRSRA